MSTQHGFQVGDKVHLKSGGPTMTVAGWGTELRGCLEIHCAWFDGHDDRHRSFKPEMLEKVTGDLDVKKYLG